MGRHFNILDGKIMFGRAEKTEEKHVVRVKNPNI